MDWLEQSLGDFDDDYVLFDCPGENWCLMNHYLADVSAIALLDACNYYSGYILSALLAKLARTTWVHYPLHCTL